jgi:predicted DNA-binding transcriptional regulator YafY
MRADRLLSMLLLLQTHRRMTAQDLAARLEVSERTIYRDMEALGSAGVPVYTERGPGGGCMLLDGYRTNLTGMTEGEVRTLLLAGAPSLASDLGLAESLEVALLKLLAALPPRFRSHIERARQRIHIDASAWSRDEEPVPHLGAIQEAVLSDKRLLLTYQKANGIVNERVIDPLGLVAKATIWYLVAASNGEMRVFRVSRVQAVAALEEACARPEGFELSAYWARWEKEFAATWPTYEVRVRVRAEHVPSMPELFGDRMRALAERTPPNADGSVTLPLTFDSLEHARSRLLGLGTAVEVIEPPELRASVAAYARQIAAFYAERANSAVTAGG